MCPDRRPQDVRAQDGPSRYADDHEDGMTLNVWPRASLPAVLSPMTNSADSMARING